jgi:hypothetical protein
LFGPQFIGHLGLQLVHLARLASGASGRLSESFHVVALSEWFRLSHWLRSLFMVLSILTWLHSSGMRRSPSMVTLCGVVSLTHFGYTQVIWFCQQHLVALKSFVSVPQSGCDLSLWFGQLGWLRSPT